MLLHGNSGVPCESMCGVKPEVYPLAACRPDPWLLEWLGSAEMTLVCPGLKVSCQLNSFFGGFKEMNHSENEVSAA